MSDIFDRASEIEQCERDGALAAHRARAANDRSPRYENGVRVCADCGERIGPKRLRANPAATRCVGCQDWHEKRKRRHGL